MIVIVFIVLFAALVVGMIFIPVITITVMLAMVFYLARESKKAPVFEDPNMEM